MNCPVCNEPMIVLEYEAVEVDYCVSCEGIWLDSGELELLFGDAQACAEFMNGEQCDDLGKEKHRRCPICGKKMHKVKTCGDNPITYDKCTRNDGLWFDKGELAQVLQDSALKHEQVEGLLKGMFGQQCKSSLETKD